VAVLKDYKIKRKLTIHKSIRNRGFEIDNIVQKGQAGNDSKLDESIYRAKAKIFELAYCNPWDKFITLTLDPVLYDRYDLSKWHKDITKWISNYNKKHGTKLKFLLIPEQHKDGAWHMHGLFMGLPDDHLIKNHNGYLDWLPYRKKFGYCSIDQIKNHEAVAKYITKYVSKNLADCIKDINAHMYYCSRGLERASEIKRGTLSANNVPWDYENDWIKCKWFTETSADLGSLIR
jgi:hypothetical protein